MFFWNSLAFSMIHKLSPLIYKLFEILHWSSPWIVTKCLLCVWSLSGSPCSLRSSGVPGASKLYPYQAWVGVQWVLGFRGYWVSIPQDAGGHVPEAAFHVTSGCGSKVPSCWMLSLSYREASILQRGWPPGVKQSYSIWRLAYTWAWQQGHLIANAFPELYSFANDLSHLPPPFLSFYFFFNNYLLAIYFWLYCGSSLLCLGFL